MLKNYKYSWLWVICTIAVICLSLISSNKMPKPPRIPYADKIVHFGFYFSYTTLFVLSFGKETRWIQPIKKVYLWALVTALLLGATMEILQGLLTTTRSADSIDMLFNTFGTIVALIFIARYKE
ncbi:VanZ family protein, partial [Capnocytophaga sputigena]